MIPEKSSIDTLHLSVHQTSSKNWVAIIPNQLVLLSFHLYGEACEHMGSAWGFFVTLSMLSTTSPCTHAKRKPRYLVPFRVCLVTIMKQWNKTERSSGQSYLVHDQGLGHDHSSIVSAVRQNLMDESGAGMWLARAIIVVPQSNTPLSLH